MIRTRFAPSPTGYLHIGGARTALFCWAYAKKHGGTFILRVEDTDLERSTQQSVQAILDGMEWLGLGCDEGPFYQMQRLNRYKEVAQQLLDAGHAYHCYCSKEELDAMREAQRARGEKPRYDGRWRDSKEKPPAGVTPVLRFKTPLTGEVTWDDQVKGPITVGNQELDDLVILRGDGVPTYNFGVVVDDIDMNITHVIRGDDHVNNTPRQINIFKALGAHAAEIRAPADDIGQRRRAAVEAPRRGQRDAIPRRRLSARGARQLPGAARLVARRRGEIFARAVGRMVRSRARQQVAGAFQSGKARVAQSAIHQRGRTSSGSLN